MPEESFSAQNRIGGNEANAGRGLTTGLLRRMIARDVELIDSTLKGGPPSEVGTGSATQVQGDIIYASDAVVGGVIYCDSFTVNPGIVIDVDRFLVVHAKGDISVYGHINANASGGFGGARGSPGRSGEGGISAGGGGGRGGVATTISGGPGGNGVLAMSGGAGGSSLFAGAANGENASISGQLEKSFVSENALGSLSGGAGGGGGGDSGGSTDSGLGGRGGGAVVLKSPIISLYSGSSVTANAGNGRWGGSQTGGGGGGGGGLVMIECRSLAMSDLSVVTANRGVGATGSGGAGGNGDSGVVQINVLG